MAINFKNLLDWKNWKKHWKWVVLGIGLFIILILVIVLIVLLASGSGSGYKEYQKIALEIHNARRKEHQADSLTLDKELNSNAEKCAKYYVTERGTIDHSCPYKGGAGENLSAAFSSPKELSALAEQASTRWYAEVKNYNFDNPGFSGSTGHFTAMVWKASKKLGVGAYKSDSFSAVVALYSPHPNFEGRYRENVLPKS